MIRLAPAVRLSIGLVILTISLLILAQAIGLAPGAARQQLESRKQLAETLASQVTLAISRGDDELLRNVLNAAVQRDEEILSAAVRRTSGDIFFQTTNHENYWQGADPQSSSATHIQFPILINGVNRARFEISMKPLSADKHPVFGLPSFVLLILFVSVSGFVGFWLYIKRILHHLDPSAVVPARVRNALNILTEGVLILDRREQIVLANNSIVEHLERSEQMLLGKKASQLPWELEENTKSRNFPWLDALATGDKQVGVRLLMKREGQKDIIFRVNAVPILDPKGKSQGTIAVFDDISEVEEKNRLLQETVEELATSRAAIEAQNKELFFLATRDPLTDCFNRRALYEHLDGKFDGARALDNEFSCIMTDIDFFKKVNDSYGHAVGDEVIKMVARSLRAGVRDMDMVARFGGEEFCIILPGVPLEKARTIAERCREYIAEHNIQGVKVTSSFGVTSIRQGAKTAVELIQQADEALYYSKQHGRNRVSCWEPGMKTIISGESKSAQ